MVKAVRKMSHMRTAGLYLRGVLSPAFVAALLGAVAMPALAQTQEQLKIFQTLPKDQQQQILEQIGESKTQQRLPAPASPTSTPKSDESIGIPQDTLLEIVPRLRAGDS